MDSVLGFQFEPEIPSNELSDDSCWETCESEDDSDNSHAENLQKSFSQVNISPEEWCKCGNCISMLSEKECKCCGSWNILITLNFRVRMQHIFNLNIFKM